MNSSTAFKTSVRLAGCCLCLNKIVKNQTFFKIISIFFSESEEPNNDNKFMGRTGQFILTYTNLDTCEQGSLSEGEGFVHLTSYRRAAVHNANIMSIFTKQVI